ncbi:MAG: hypothetical protein HC876_12325 [Chloroflexaceae bacterium]|nr:hypothetical protein [Chloroflexaceae bacterium]NJO06233.1 hypothetical protein [Chloroflexaceae bacterium]
MNNTWQQILIHIEVVLGIAALVAALVLVIVLIIRRRHRHTYPHAPRFISESAVQTIRKFLGWFCIGIGIPLFILPIPLGLPLLITGAILIGPQSRTLRLFVYNVRRTVRRLACTDWQPLRSIGKQLLTLDRKMTGMYRQQVRPRIQPRPRAAQTVEFHEPSALPEPATRELPTEV